MWKLPKTCAKLRPYFDRNTIYNVLERTVIGIYIRLILRETVMHRKLNLYSDRMFAPPYQGYDSLANADIIVGIFANVSTDVN